MELPGHGKRLAEPLVDTADELVDALAEELEPFFDKPLAIFGHSMGALLGFELARFLRDEGAEPLYLLVSGHVAPQLDDSPDPIHQLPKVEFIEKIRELEGTPEEVLKNAELRELVLPILRADFKVCETYKFEERTKLDCPITAFGGLADQHVRREDLEAWRHRTSGPFSLRMFRGGHFFINTSTESVLSEVARCLTNITHSL